MAKTIEELIPEYIRGLPVYVPGKPIEEVEQELKIRAVKLASNENPLGPSPKAMEAVKRALAESHRYPDGGTHHLREKLAGLHKVMPEEIFIGLGSSEIIDLASRVVLGAGKAGVTSEGSYAPFSVAIRASGAKLIRVPLRDFAFDLPAISEAITPDTRVVYLANPNNPTGTAFGMADLEEFFRRLRSVVSQRSHAKETIPQGLKPIEAADLNVGAKAPTPKNKVDELRIHETCEVLVVLDEAYIHYAERADMPRSLEIFRAHKNLLIMRTFSKVYGLAGMRIGYGIGQTPLVAAMNKLRTPFNVSGVAQAAAIAALDDNAHVHRSIETNCVERRRIFEGLTQLSLRAVRSEANFVFVDIGSDAPAICQELLQDGVIVRPLGWMGLPEAIRISVGTSEENGKMLASVARVCARRAGEGELAPR